MSFCSFCHAATHLECWNRRVVIFASSHRFNSTYIFFSAITHWLSFHIKMNKNDVIKSITIIDEYNFLSFIDR